MASLGALVGQRLRHVRDGGVKKGDKSITKLETREDISRPLPDEYRLNWNDRLAF